MPPLDPRRDRSPSDDTSSASQRSILCRACGAEVTRPEHAVAVGAAGLHTFVNPTGHVFELRTFGQAPGCRAIGPATSHWTWFPGHAWRVGLCRGCGQHLGWHYFGDTSFWGLIAAELHEPQG